MNPWTLSYNTNGFAHHRLDEALMLLGELGYRGVALTLDVHHLDPFAPDLERRAAEVRRTLEKCGLAPTIETGARFNLDFRRKHYPSLMVRDPMARRIRIDFILRSIDTAVLLGAPIVSVWSGHNFDAHGHDVALTMLTDGLRETLDYAAARNVKIAFEPEPGMFVETLDDYVRLRDRLNHPAFGLALDLGHLLVTGETPIADRVHRFAKDILIVAIEDMKRGVHDHLMFGDGDMDFPPIFQALRAIDYRGPLAVELSRHSSQAPEAARRAMHFLSHPPA